MKRFQECNKIVQIWRYRWYLLIPFQWIRIAILKQLDPHPQDDIPLKHYWGVLKGMAQVKMNWTYTIDEVSKRIKDKYDLG